MPPIPKQSELKISYFNENGVNITANIESGKTLFFEYRSEAQKEADKKRTYVFDIYNHREHIGFGVTK